MPKGNLDQLIQRSETPVLIDFWADWCGPCHAMAPVLQQLAQEHKGHLKVVKIDVDKNPAVSNRFGIRSIPTLVLFKDSKPVWRHSGTMPYANLVAQLKPWL